MPVCVAVGYVYTRLHFTFTHVLRFTLVTDYVCLFYVTTYSFVVLPHGSSFTFVVTLGCVRWFTLRLRVGLPVTVYPGYRLHVYGWIPVGYVLVGLLLRYRLRCYVYVYVYVGYVAVVVTHTFVTVTVLHYTFGYARCYVYGYLRSFGLRLFVTLRWLHFTHFGWLPPRLHYTVTAHSCGFYLTHVLRWLVDVYVYLYVTVTFTFTCVTGFTHGCYTFVYAVGYTHFRSCDLQFHVRLPLRSGCCLYVYVCVGLRSAVSALRLPLHYVLDLVTVGWFTHRSRSLVLHHTRLHVPGCGWLYTTHTLLFTLRYRVAVYVCCYLVYTHGLRLLACYRCYVGLRLLICYRCYVRLRYGCYRLPRVLRYTVLRLLPRHTFYTCSVTLPARLPVGYVCYVAVRCLPRVYHTTVGLPLRCFALVYVYVHARLRLLVYYTRWLLRWFIYGWFPFTAFTFAFAVTVTVYCTFTTLCVLRFDYGLRFTVTVACGLIHGLR